MDNTTLEPVLSMLKNRFEGKNDINNSKRGSSVMSNNKSTISSTKSTISSTR